MSTVPHASTHSYLTSSTSTHTTPCTSPLTLTDDNDDDDDRLDIDVSTPTYSDIFSSTQTSVCNTPVTLIGDEGNEELVSLAQPDFACFDSILPQFQTMNITPLPTESRRFQSCPPAPTKMWIRPQALHVDVEYTPRTYYELLWSKSNTPTAASAFMIRRPCTLVDPTTVNHDPVSLKRARDTDDMTERIYCMRNFMIEEKIYQGNHIIWRVTNQDGKIMAIKRSFCVLTPSATRLYVCHIRSFSDVSNENGRNHLMEYYAVWSELGYVYTLMDYVPYTLTSYLSTILICDSVVLRLLSHVTTALHAIETHANQLSHRRPEYIRTRTRGVDHATFTLEPSHILMTHDGQCVMLAGDYRADGGNPRYMAPCISNDTSQEHLISTALYSLGFILYECITCDRCITHGARHQMLRSSPPDPTTWNLCYHSTPQIPQLVASLMTMDRTIQPNLQQLISSIIATSQKLLITNQFAPPDISQQFHQDGIPKQNPMVGTRLTLQVSSSSPIQLPKSISSSFVAASSAPPTSFKRLKCNHTSSLSFITPPTSPDIPVRGLSCPTSSVVYPIIG